MMFLTGVMCCLRACPGPD